MRRDARHARAAAAVAALLAITMTAVAMSPALASSSVVASDFKFTPGTITVHVGDTVVWANHGPSAHTVTANNGSFNSGNLNSGQSFSHTFASAGTFAYHCIYHQSIGMIGTVVVLGSSTGGGPTSVPLPNTGAGPRFELFAGLGVLLLVAGAALVISSRRRRA